MKLPEWLDKYVNLLNHMETKPVGERNLYEKELRAIRDEANPLDRVLHIFEPDPLGELHPEIDRIQQYAAAAAIAGFFLGGVPAGYEAMLDFKRRNAHEVFLTPGEANKRMQAAMMYGFGVGGYRVAWRMGLFSFIYAGISGVMAVYRGKRGIYEHVAGAGTAGFLYKLKAGPKPAVSGLAVGSALGLTLGLATTGICLLTGMSQDDIVEHHYQTVVNRRQNIKDYSKHWRYDDDEKHEVWKFHEAYMASDDLALANVKGTDINTMVEGVNRHKDPLSESDFEGIMPAAVKKAVKSAADSLEAPITTSNQKKYVVKSLSGKDLAILLKSLKEDPEEESIDDSKNCTKSVKKAITASSNNKVAGDTQ